MKYDNPQLTEIGLACEAITSTAKEGGYFDSEDLPSTPAYEAEE